MHKLKKVLPVITFPLVLTFCSFGLSQAAQNNEPEKFTLDRAVQYAIDNSLEMEQVYLTLKANEENQDKAYYNAKKLHKGENSLDQGKSSLNTAKDQLENVNQAIAQMDAAGADKNSPDYKKLVSTKEKLEAGIAAGETNLKAGKESFQEGIKKVSTELNLAGVTTNNLTDASSAADLMKTSADIALSVTNAGVLIQKQGLALQVENAYYDVLEKQRLVKVQQDTLNLATQLYQFAKNSYDTGFSAKDEYLLAQLQVKAAKMKLLQAQHNLQLAKNQLKQLMNYDLKKDIVLEDNFTTKAEELNLDQGLEKGLNKRLEILKGNGELLIARLNLSITAKSYTPNTYYYREAELQQEQAELNIKKQKSAVTNSILNSYNAVQTAKAALETVRDMEKLAQENLEIATYKYKAGFGEDSKLLKQMDTENLSGTIAEVLAAQEKVSEVQAAVVNAIYNYNLSLAKYKFDTGEY
ncbi:TolC family protein [Bacillota bacterium LX-D]|nr:TolC family protein [Bacillota bacterium LX-D]